MSYKTYLCHQDHYIFEGEISLKIHPYVTECLFIDMFIRPVVSKNEYIILGEDGSIEGATKNITKTLNLSCSDCI